jgi:Family of unknown function (DUF5681)
MTHIGDVSRSSTANERIVTMSKRKSSKAGVGYRQPPKTTQFKKGKSGNPRGRPKGSRNVGAVLRDVIDQKVQITENGKIRRLPGLEVMLRQSFIDAMRSGPAERKFFFSLIDRYADLNETALVPDIDEVLAEDQEILARYLGKASGTTSGSLACTRFG